MPDQQDGGVEDKGREKSVVELHVDDLLKCLGAGRFGPWVQKFFECGAPEGEGKVNGQTCAKMSQPRRNWFHPDGRVAASELQHEWRSNHPWQPFNNRSKEETPQAWCIPSERMTKTVCVASNRPTADQMAALHNHWDDSADLRTVFITRIVFYDVGVAAGNAANRQTNAASGIAKARLSRDTSSMIAKMIFALMALVSLGASRSVLVYEASASRARAGVHGRWTDETAGALSRVGVSDYWV